MEVLYEVWVWVGSSVYADDRVDGVCLLSVGVDLDDVRRDIRYCYLVHLCGVQVLVRVHCYVCHVVCRVSCDREHVLIDAFVVEAVVADGDDVWFLFVVC